MKTLWQWIRFVFLAPLLIIAALISNRADGGPDIAGRDNRAFKWLPWGRKSKN